MPEPSTLAQRLKTEYSALKSLRKTHPGLFVLLLAITTIFGLLWCYEKFWGKPVLESKVASQAQQILLLETQLTPFKTIALQRYPGQLGDAMLKLTGDLEKLEKLMNESERKIRSMSVFIETHVRARWKNGKLPELHELILMGGTSNSVDVTFIDEDKNLHPTKFFGMNSMQFRDADDGVTVVSYFANVGPDSSVFGLLNDAIKKTKDVSFGTGIVPFMLEEKKLVIVGCRLIFIANGVKAFELRIDETSHADMTAPDYKTLMIHAAPELPLTMITK